MSSRWHGQLRLWSRRIPAGGPAPASPVPTTQEVRPRTRLVLLGSRQAEARAGRRSTTLRTRTVDGREPSMPVTHLSRRVRGVNPRCGVWCDHVGCRQGSTDTLGTVEVGRTSRARRQRMRPRRIRGGGSSQITEQQCEATEQVNGMPGHRLFESLGGQQWAPPDERAPAAMVNYWRPETGTGVGL